MINGYESFSVCVESYCQYLVLFSPLTPNIFTKKKRRSIAPHMSWEVCCRDIPFGRRFSLVFSRWSLIDWPWGSNTLSSVDRIVSVRVTATIFGLKAVHWSAGVRKQSLSSAVFGQWVATYWLWVIPARLVALTSTARTLTPSATMSLTRSSSSSALPLRSTVHCAGRHQRQRWPGQAQLDRALEQSVASCQRDHATSTRTRSITLCRVDSIASSDDIAPCTSPLDRQLQLVFWSMIFLAANVHVGSTKANATWKATACSCRTRGLSCSVDWGRGCYVPPKNKLFFGDTQHPLTEVTQWLPYNDTSLSRCMVTAWMLMVPLCRSVLERVNQGVHEQFQKSPCCSFTNLMEQTHQPCKPLKVRQNSGLYKIHICHKNTKTTLAYSQLWPSQTRQQQHSKSVGTGASPQPHPISNSNSERHHITQSVSRFLFIYLFIFYQFKLCANTRHLQGPEKTRKWLEYEQKLTTWSEQRSVHSKGDEQQLRRAFQARCFEVSTTWTPQHNHSAMERWDMSISSEWNYSSSFASSLCTQTNQWRKLEIEISESTWKLWHNVNFLGHMWMFPAEFPSMKPKKKNALTLMSMLTQVWLTAAPLYTDLRGFDK